jgi:hypothetical protein
MERVLGQVCVFCGVDGCDGEGKRYYMHQGAKGTMVGWENTSTALHRAGNGMAGYDDEYMDNFAGAEVFLGRAGGRVCVYTRQKEVKTHHTNPCARFKSKEENTKEILHSREFFVGGVSPCSPISLLHSPSTQYLDAPASPVENRYYSHEAADTLDDQIQTNQPSRCKKNSQ